MFGGSSRMTKITKKKKTKQIFIPVKLFPIDIYSNTWP